GLGSARALSDPSGHVAGRAHGVPREVRPDGAVAGAPRALLDALAVALPDPDRVPGLAVDRHRTDAAGRSRDGLPRPSAAGRGAGRGGLVPVVLPLADPDLGHPGQ